MADAFIVRGDDGEEYGPVRLDELRDWVRENRAGLGTTVRTDETGSLWQPWQYYPELVALLAEFRAGGPGVGMNLAPMPRRMIAFIIDVVLIYLLLIPFIMVVLVVGLPDVFVPWDLSMQTMMQTGQTTYVPPEWVQTLFTFIFCGGLVLYVAGFLAAHGRTPAKSLLRIRVVDEHGDKPSPLRALLRGLVLSFSLFFFCVPLLYVFVNPQRRALHDLAAGTYVVDGLS